MKIRRKLLSSFLGFSALVVVLGVFSTYQVQDQIRLTQRTFNKATLGIADLVRIEAAFHGLQRAIRDLLIDEDPSFARPDLSDKAKKDLGQDQSDLQRALKDYETTLVGDDERALWNDLAKDSFTYASALERTSKTLDSGDLSGARILLLVSVGKSASNEVAAAIDALVNFKNKTAAVWIQQQQDSATTGLAVTLILMVFSILASVGGGLALSVGLAGPLGKVAELGARVSEGDLSFDLDRRLLMRKDEVGALAAAFKGMIERLRLDVGSIRTVGDELNSTASALDTEAVATVNATTAILEVTGGVKSAVAVQVEGVGAAARTSATIVAMIAKLQNLIETQGKDISQSSAAVEQMIANVRAIQTRSQNMETAFRHLESTSDAGRVQVQDLVDLTEQIAEESARLVEANAVIQAIAGQTNLLAMNAAIEAAHAGEMGKGFAVVAEEIRVLAEGSSLQTRDIAKDIQGIQDRIDASRQASLATERAFGEIGSQISTVARLEAEIVAALAEQAEGSQQVLEAITRMNSLTGEVRDGSVQVARDGREIQDQTESLFSKTSEVQNGMDRIAEGASDINEGASRVEELGRTQRDLAGRLSNAVDRFNLE